MLGKIVKKLRIFGFDSEFVYRSSDQFILQRSKNENRIIITKDKELYKRSLKQNKKSILLLSEIELENILNILKENKVNFIPPIPNNDTRCTICNGSLNQMDKNHITNKIPHSVFEKSNIFYKCSKCAKIYWNGTHISKIQSLIDLINQSLLDN